MDQYMRLLRWTLIHRWSAVVGGIGALAATVFMFTVLPNTFLPEEDNDSVTAIVELVPGSTLQQSEAVVQRTAQILRAQPDVEAVYTRAFVGNGRVTAQLKEDRKQKSYEFQRAIGPQLSSIPDARVSFRAGGWGGGSGRALTITLGGDDPAKLNEAAVAIVDQMRALPTIRSPLITGDLQRPEITIRPRLDLAANLGVTTQALSSAIRIATLGDIDQNSARFSLSDRQIPIRVALDQGARQKLSTIENLPVQTGTGGSVPLKVVADIGFGAGPTKIERSNQQRRITIGADLAPGEVSGEAMKKVRGLSALKNLPVGVNELKLGESKQQAEMIQNFVGAVLAGIFLVFSVLVLLYRRVMPPFVNMGSLLLAPLGGLIALWICGMPISLSVYIGVLMLLGIVAKNSILLIDFALEEMAKGIDPFSAMLDAGHKRAQPIVMTTVAMVAGMVPTALSLSGDGSFRQPMSVVVIGGLTLSTLLTLVIVPASFSLAVGIEGWIGPKLGRRLLTYRPGDEHGPTIEGGHPGQPVLPAGQPKLGGVPDPAE